MVNYYGDDVLIYQLLTILSTWGLLILALLVLAIIARWKIFTKAGEPGWACLVPFYHSYVEFKIFWGNGWLFLAPIALGLLSVIPIIGVLFTIVTIVIEVMMQYKKSLAFGERIGFCLGLIFLPTIFNMILGFSSKYQYLGVPQDGVTYKDMKEKYDSINDRPVSYEAKPEEKIMPMEYEKPESKEEYRASKVDVEEIKPSVEAKKEKEITTNEK